MAKKTVDGVALKEARGAVARNKRSKKSARTKAANKEAAARAAAMHAMKPAADERQMAIPGTEAVLAKFHGERALHMGNVRRLGSALAGNGTRVRSVRVPVHYKEGAALNTWAEVKGKPLAQLIREVTLREALKLPEVVAALEAMDASKKAGESK